MAKKKLPKGVKAAFVRNQPLTHTAEQVVDAAKEAGITIGRAYVYNIRSHSLITAQKLLKKKEVFPGKKRSFLEEAFKEIVVKLGPSRAQHLLTSVSQSLKRTKKTKKK